MNNFNQQLGITGNSCPWCGRCPHCGQRGDTPFYPQVWCGTPNLCAQSGVGQCTSNIAGTNTPDLSTEPNPKSNEEIKG